MLLLPGSLCHVLDSHTANVKHVIFIRTGKGKTANKNREGLLMIFCFPYLLGLSCFEMAWLGMYAMTTDKCLLCFFALYVANV